VETCLWKEGHRAELAAFRQEDFWLERHRRQEKEVVLVTLLASERYRRVMWGDVAAERWPS
jgi:hypothetical protein